MNFKPMLSADASNFDLTKIRWPMLVSPKLDGLRCIVWEGVAYSRNAKPFRNHFVQAWAADKHNLDGELVVGSPTDPDCLNISKAVTAYEGEPDFTFHLFDSMESVSEKFEDRLDYVQDQMRDEERIECVPHFMVNSVADFIAVERIWVEEGYEGVMLRHPSGPYKHGRSTMNEQFLMKYKRFIDGEAVVLRLEEGSTNTNTLQKDELGRAKRSFVKSGLVGNSMVGTLICQDPTWGEIRVSPGKMPHAERQAYWRTSEFIVAMGGNQCRAKGADEPNIIGKTIHWRSFGYGTKDAPRFARYYGIVEDV